MNSQHQRVRVSEAPVRTGADVLEAEDFVRLSGRRVGLVCNQSSVVERTLEHLADAMARSEHVELKALFAPEHGLRGEAQDMISVGAEMDPRLQLPVHSLYGSTVESLTPRAADLEGLDLLIFDLQDVGSRYYTFAATLVLCMRRCSELGLPLMVLDRPNPLGGEAVEGGSVEEGFESFVGLIPLPVRHGLTVAEIAKYAKARESLDLELQIVEMQGWSANQRFDETGLSWIPPSPNMPTLSTAWVYPGMCLIEATTLSEGRGTTRPFEQFGAPELDSMTLLSALTEADPLGCCAGLRLRECRFIPGFQKWAQQSCGGLFLHVQDPTAFSAWRFGQHLIYALKGLFSGFEWRAAAYEFVEEVPAIDLLTGSAVFRECVEAQASLGDVFEVQRERLAPFKQIRRDHFIYPRLNAPGAT